MNNGRQIRKVKNTRGDDRPQKKFFTSTQTFYFQLRRDKKKKYFSCLASSRDEVFGSWPRGGASNLKILKRAGRLSVSVFLQILYKNLN